MSTLIGSYVTTVIKFVTIVGDEVFSVHDVLLKQLFERPQTQKLSIDATNPSYSYAYSTLPLGLISDLNTLGNTIPKYTVPLFTILKCRKNRYIQDTQNIWNMAHSLCYSLHIHNL